MSTVNIFEGTAPAIASPQYTLRPYQQAAVDAAVKYLMAKHDKNGLLVLPTGSGKSLVVAGIIHATKMPTLVLQPNKEILFQNVEKYRSYGGRCGIYSASAGEKRMEDVTFATIGSVIKKLDRLERFHHILIDECHLVNAKAEGSMYAVLVNTLSAKVIGMTATPYRLGKTFDHQGNARAILKFLTRTSPRIFNQVIYHVQNRRLFDDGHLCKLVYHEVHSINRNALQRNSTGADFTDESVRRQYEISGFYAKVVQVVNRLFDIGRKNCLVFTRFTKEAAYVAQNVPGAVIVTAETPTKERDRIIAGFRAGRIRCVCNVGILTTGFDYPELEAVVVARPTMSLGLYYQMIGRAIRPHPEKKDAMIIDMGGNLRQFGKVEDLELSDEGGWHVHSGGKVLTGVAFGDTFR